jgi:glutathione S-transferase
MSQTLRLLGNPVSPFSTKVHYFLEEAGRPYKYTLIDLAKGEQSTEQFQRLNPLGAVPTIECNGFSMGESNAILRYLAQRFELDAFYPANLEDRAGVDQLMEFVSLHVNRYLLSLAWNLHWAPKFGQKPNQAFIDDARTQLNRYLPKLEKHLIGRSYLAGANLTLADVTLLPFAAQHRNAEVSFSDFPNVAAWLGRMSERPAWKKTQTEIEKLLP